MSEKEQQNTDGRPPILGKWSNFYWLVFGVLVLLIIIFYFITNYYA